MSQQWLRACSLVVGDDTDAIELAGDPANPILRIKFTVHYYTKESPASLHARVYNLSPQTIQSIIGFTQKNPPKSTGVAFATSGIVVLKAGYIENFDQIFKGYVYQLRVGKESNVDSYLDIFAADGDEAHNWATMNTTLAAGYTAKDVYQSCGESMKKWQVATGPAPNGLDASSGSPRGRVCFGMTRDVLRDLGESHNFTWNILNQQLEAHPKFTARPGDAIIINRFTGMIGIPEQTDQGISVVTLLNPAIRWGTLVQINDTDIARLVINNPNANYAIPLSPAFKDQGAIVPPINSDGNYVVVHARYEGDTRGNPWYVHMVCLSIDKTAVIPKAATDVKLPPPITGGKIQGAA
jgi:hypothetical protein